MRNALKKRVIEISSLDYQVKNIVNGNMDSYLLPEDLLDSTTSLIATILDNQSVVSSFTSQELSEISLFRKKLLETYVPEFGDAVSKDSLINHHPDWIEIRLEAAKLLSLLQLGESRTLEN